VVLLDRCEPPPYVGNVTLTLINSLGRNVSLTCTEGHRFPTGQRYFTAECHQDGSWQHIDHCCGICSTCYHNISCESLIRSEECYFANSRCSIYLAWRTKFGNRRTLLLQRGPYFLALGCSLVSLMVSPSATGNSGASSYKEHETDGQTDDNTQCKPHNYY